MNKKKRASLSSAVQMLEQAKNIVEDVAFDEQDAMDNFPENMQTSDKYEAMEDAVDKMEDAEQEIESAIDALNEAME